MSEVLFKDVPIGAEFGYKDYFMYKDTATTAVFSGDQHYFGEYTKVFLEDEEDDFLAGVTCNPDAPEECESCQ